MPDLQWCTGLRMAFGSAGTPRPVPHHGAFIAFHTAAQAWDCLSFVLWYSPTPHRLGALLHCDIDDGCTGVAGMVGVAGIAGDDGGDDADGGIWAAPQCLHGNRRSARAPSCWPSSSAGSSTWKETNLAVSPLFSCLWLAARFLLASMCTAWWALYTDASPTVTVTCGGIVSPHTLASFRKPCVNLMYFHHTASVATSGMWRITLRSFTWFSCSG